MLVTAILSILLRLAAATLLLVAMPALGAVDPKVKEECMKAQDFVGCVKALSSDQLPSSQEPQIDKLRSALRLLPSRIQNTNLRDFTTNTQIFTDAVASIDESRLQSNYEIDLYSEALAIKAMLAALQSYWSTRISDGTNYSNTGLSKYNCPILRASLSIYNSVAGKDYSVRFYSYTTKHGLFGHYKVENCSPQESSIIKAIIKRTNEALVDPKIKKARLEQARRAQTEQLRLQELERMEPWSRHLEMNPGLKIWAEANPQAAEKEKEKFLRKYESKHRETQAPLETKPQPAYKFNCAEQPTKELYTKCMTNQI